jgi:RNA polymerase sigma-70 factor (ECF subfamily)
MLDSVRQDMPPDIDESDDVVSRLVLHDAIRLAIARLDEKYRDVLLLFAGPELSYEEISRALGIPVGTVRSRLFRGRARLLELLGVEGQIKDKDTPLELRSIQKGPPR